jgi:hypothetical protein
MSVGDAASVQESIMVGQLSIRYLIDGTATGGMGVFELSVPPGDWMFTPRGSVHQFSNPHSEMARALIVLTPDIGAQYFREVATVVNRGGPPDRSKLLEVMSKYGLAPAPPR